MVRARDVLSRARGTRPLHDEVEAGAEALRMGVDGARVGELAQSAPSGRSLVVPLYVIGSLVERGLPSDHALERVRERLKARGDGRGAGAAVEGAGRAAARDGPTGAREPAGRDGA
jgi:hypothetical protein